jgi:hypothetical protein
VLTDRAYEEDRRQGATRSDAAFHFLGQLVEPDRDELETRRQLVWHHFFRALYYASYGAWDRAQKAIGAARSLNDQADELVALDLAVAQAIAQEQEDGLDITPFLPHL